ncbi:hypothetical protein JCM13580A_23000 [Streptomyces drozdowiczii]
MASSSGDRGVDAVLLVPDAAAAVPVAAVIPPNAAAMAAAAATVQRILCLVRLIAPPRVVVTPGIYWSVGVLGIHGTRQVLIFLGDFREVER